MHSALTIAIKVPLSKGIYPGLITTKIPINPTIKAVILCILITSPKNIIARIVAEKWCGKPNSCSTFFFF